MPEEKTVEEMSNDEVQTLRSEIAAEEFGEGSVPAIEEKTPESSLPPEVQKEKK